MFNCKTERNLPIQGNIPLAIINVFNYRDRLNHITYGCCSGSDRPSSATAVIIFFIRVSF